MSPMMGEQLPLAETVSGSTPNPVVTNTRVSAPLDPVVRPGQRWEVDQLDITAGMITSLGDVLFQDTEQYVVQLARNGQRVASVDMDERSRFAGFVAPNLNLLRGVANLSSPLVLQPGDQITATVICTTQTAGGISAGTRLEFRVVLTGRRVSRPTARGAVAA